MVSKFATHDCKYFLEGDILVKTDRCSMRYGLEARVPLLDHKLIEFIDTIPFSQVWNGEKKHLLKEVSKKHLPDHIIKQPKQGFNVPIDRWLRDDLSSVVNKYFNKSFLSRYVDFLHPENVIQMKKGFQANKVHHYSIWNMLMLLKWFEKNNI